VITNDKFYGKFEAWARGYKKAPVKITVINDGTTTPEGRRGSIGDIDFTVKTQKISEDILVIGGDNLFNFQTGQFFDFAISQKDKVTIGLYQIKDVNEAKKFGVVAVDVNRAVTSFEEKPEQPKSNLIAMCFYYMPTDTLPLITQYIAEGGKVDLAGDYIKWLCEQKRLCGFQFKGSWYDIGSLEAYKEAQDDFKKNK
jgi:glucose-1-phosphate thymidylyltransferase